MGSSQSQQQSALFESNYLKELRSGHPYFGTHYLLLNRNQKQMIINKQLIFRSSAEYRQFIAEYEKIERKPFNVIYPKLLIKSGGIETCSNIYEVNAYFQIVGRNLTQVIRTQGCLTESKAWFLLNEVSKSLEIMAEGNRPHWAITPENIYQNSYQNYFIYDTLFVLGFDPQSFLMKRLENNELISEKMKARLQKGNTVSQTQGFQEDCYGLGFVMLFALTGVHPSQMPSDAYQRTLAVKNILNEKRGSIGKDMIQIIVLLTEREALKRMDNFQLRRLLKDKEACIIRNEDYQYQRSRRREVMTPRQLQMQFNPLRGLGNPHLQQFPRDSNHFQVHHPPNYAPFSQKRLPHQLQTVIRMHQNPLPMRIHEKHPQAVHHITQISDYPSDRSNALTRINSYDRLITKK